MGNKCSPELTLYLLITASFCLEAAVINKIFFCPPEKLSWEEARMYCQRNHIDLMSWNPENTFPLTEWLMAIEVKQVWLGMHRSAEKEWEWINVKTGRGLSGNDRPQNYNWVDGRQKWIENWPSKKGKLASGEFRTTNCGFFDVSGVGWGWKNCSKELHFVCYDDNLVVVNKNKTWEEAWRHCRGMKIPCHNSSEPCKYRHNILSHPEDHSYVRARITGAMTDEVWVGLRFLGGKWYWMTGQEPDKQEMLPECPLEWNYCGAMSKYNTNNWITRDCSERRNFICYRHEK